MRCLHPFLLIIISGLMPMIAESQEALPVIVDASHDLPKESLKSRYRIQIMESRQEQAEDMRKVARDFTLKYRQCTYILRNGDVRQLQAGDYPEKRFAKLKYCCLKKNFKKLRIVKSVNDSIVEYSCYEKRRPVKPFPPAVPADMPVAVERTKEKAVTEYPGWNVEACRAANTAKNENYLTHEEQQVYFYLNLVRTNPKLFADTYFSDLRNSTEYYESTLFMELQQLEPLPVLKPNRLLYQSAQCHAIESGKSGYIGHDRAKCKENFRGECCHYGMSDALEIIKNLLIDRNVESLGHRRICLGHYTELGVSIQPHKSYGENAVLDFQ